MQWDENGLIWEQWVKLRPLHLLRTLKHVLLPLTVHPQNQCNYGSLFGRFKKNAIPLSNMRGPYSVIFTHLKCRNSILFSCPYSSDVVVGLWVSNRVKLETLLGGFFKIPFAHLLQKRSSQIIILNHHYLSWEAIALYCWRNGWGLGLGGTLSCPCANSSSAHRGSENSLKFVFHKQLCKYVSASLVTGSTCNEAVKQPEQALNAEKQPCFMLPKGPYLVERKMDTEPGQSILIRWPRNLSCWNPYLVFAVKWQNLFRTCSPCWVKLIDTELKSTALGHILERDFKFLCSCNEVPGWGKAILHTLVYPRK